MRANPENSQRSHCSSIFGERQPRLFLFTGSGAYVGHSNDLRVLVVEDELLIGLDVADLLRDRDGTSSDHFDQLSPR